MSLRETELILNSDGSIYHLNLFPEDISDTIITVGDPERVEEVTKHFDSIEISRRKREFYTQTGYYGGKRITVISTGIGTDNIDIVLNELDALANINFKRRTTKPEFTKLTFIRIGTSGALQPNIKVDAFLVSEYAIGTDSLMNFYNYDWKSHEDIIQKQWADISWINKQNAYIARCDKSLLQFFNDSNILHGITITCPGFYGPQFRTLRLNSKNGLTNYSQLLVGNEKISNLEMETAGIYALSELLGHRAVSLNAILANRSTGEFSSDPGKTVNELVEYGLNKILLM